MILRCSRCFAPLDILRPVNNLCPLCGGILISTKPPFIARLLCAALIVLTFIVGFFLTGCEGARSNDLQDKCEPFYQGLDFVEAAYAETHNPTVIVSGAGRLDVTCASGSFLAYERDVNGTTYVTIQCR